MSVRITLRSCLRTMNRYSILSQQLRREVQRNQWTTRTGIHRREAAMLSLCISKEKKRAYRSSLRLGSSGSVTNYWCSHRREARG
jgi:hypothetical protein